MLGLFGGKDWNVVGIIFERPDLYRVNANRGKGGQATTIRDAVKGHDRTIVWAVFDQKGGLLECQPGPGANRSNQDRSRGFGVGRRPSLRS